MNSVYRLMIAVLAAMAMLSGAARAQAGQGVDFTKLSVDGVMVGDTVDGITQTLGKPKAVKGAQKQYLVYGSGTSKLTIQLTADLRNAAFLRDGSKLALDGRTLLKVGDPVSKCDGELGMAHQVRNSPQGQVYYYYQPTTMRELLIGVYRGRIQSFTLGSR